MAKDKAAANRELKNAQQDLETIAKADKKAGRTHETPGYQAANARANAAAKAASWWNR